MQLYLHFPFCKSKCRYCDFNSFACHDKNEIIDYLTWLDAEILLASKEYGGAKIDTIYLGGGTPSLLDEDLIFSACEKLWQNFDLSGVKEWTIECNPESLSKQKLEVYKRIGINRVSIGVQSLFDDNLRAIGRLHDAEGAIEAIKLAREYFQNVSADLIIGLPYDTKERVKKQVETLAPLVEHLSIYELSVEKGTALEKLVKSGKIVLPNDDETQELFDVAYDKASALGFDRYEVSNFAKDGKVSLHNLGYWQREEYIGFGAGAHSFLRTKEGKTPLEKPRRFANFCNLKEYAKAVQNAQKYGDIPRDFVEILSEKDCKNEEIMLSLRTKFGVREELLQNLPQNLEKFFARGNGRICLTREGMAVMNSVLVEILDD